MFYNSRELSLMFNRDDSLVMRIGNKKVVHVEDVFNKVLVRVPELFYEFDNEYAYTLIRLDDGTKLQYNDDLVNVTITKPLCRCMTMRNTAKVYDIKTSCD